MASNIEQLPELPTGGPTRRPRIWSHQTSSSLSPVPGLDPSAKLTKDDVTTSDFDKNGDHESTSERRPDSVGDDKASDDVQPPKIFEELKAEPGLYADALPVGEIESSDVLGDSPEYRDIPLNVREAVSFEDDPTEFFVLSLFFCGIGAFVSQMAWFRTTSAPFSVLFVQIASHWMGHWMADLLPAWDVNLGFFKFNLNPGPFSLKEHVLITIASASGATSNLGEIIVSVKYLYYDEVMHPAAAMAFMIATIWTGYFFAYIARSFLIYDPALPFPGSLQSTALFRSLRAQAVGQSELASKQASHDKVAFPWIQRTDKWPFRDTEKMRIFWLVFAGVFFWQFLPEYVFPMTSSLAVLCWFASHNEVVSFVGSGLGGMAVLNFTLDWSNISFYGNPLLTPWWTQVILFVCFVLSSWILIPIFYFGKLANSDKYDILSNKLFLENGTLYPYRELITQDAHFNQTAYDLYGPPYMGAQAMWNIFFSYASYTSAFVWIALFGGPKIVAMVKRIWKKRGKVERTDKLNLLMKAYPEVPGWWYLILFVACFVTIIVLIPTAKLYLPIWTYIIALILGGLTVIPFGFVYALSNFQVSVGVFNELIYGYMLDANGTSRHPIGSLVYRVISGQCWYRAQSFLQDQKIGHYMHVPPRAVFFAQLFGTIIGAPINYGTIRWILDSKKDYLTGEKTDPNHQWTGQQPISYNAAAVQYGLIGPKRLFVVSAYSPLLYGFLLGALAPVLIWGLHRRFPKAKFNLWNTTIFTNQLGNFTGNLSTGPLTSFIVAFFSMFYCYRFKHKTWARFNYLLSASFDAAFNLNMLAIFIFFSAFKTVVMPNWWGNDAGSIEKCYAFGS